MEKDLREILKSPFLWLVLCSFFLVEKNKKEKIYQIIKNHYVIH